MMSDIWRSLRNRQALAVGTVIVFTLAIIGGVLLTATSLGCSPANALGLTSISARCSKPLASRSPGTPAASPSPGPSATPPIASSPTTMPSATVPDTGPASSAYPPFYPGAGGANGTMRPALGLSCDLPVYFGPPGDSGFLVYPGGSFAADPKSAVTVPTPAPGSPTPQPPGPPQQGPAILQDYAYDAAVSKWLPVGPTFVAPDGTRYAAPATRGVYVVDVASQAMTLIGAGQAWTIVGVQAVGVYASHPGDTGLWLLPFSGVPREITSVGFWQAVGKSSAYGTQTPTSALPPDAINDIIRVDLQTGSVTSWFTRQGAQSGVLGVDSAGAAIVSVVYQHQSVSEVWAVGAPNAGTPILGNYYGYPASGIETTGAPVADNNGIWFPASYSVPHGTGTTGFALYVPNRGVYWMGSLATQSNSDVGAQLAGGCTPA